jgi:hypothetical protein
MAIHTTYHFVGLGSINAVGVAQLEETENVAIGDWPPQNGVVLSSGQATGHGWDYISLKDGWPLTGHATLTMSFTASKSAAGTKPAPATKRDLPASGTFTVHAETTYHLQP